MPGWWRSACASTRTSPSRRLLVVDEDDLDGLPDEYRAGLAGDGDGRLPGHDGVPGRRAVHGECRAGISESKLSLFNNRAVDTNRALLAEAVALREQVAELFGRPSWAHHTMDEQMAKDPETVKGSTTSWSRR